MKKPSMPRPINLPYASTVASFYGDQGMTQGNSFLSRAFRQIGGRGPGMGGGAGAGGGGAGTVTQTQAPNPRRR